MKRLLPSLLAAVAGLLIAGLVVSRHAADQRAADQAEFNRQRAEWQAEKARLETALKQAGNRTQRPLATAPAAQAAPAMEAEPKTTPADVVKRLEGLKVTASQPRSVREAIHQFETLIEFGPSALPAIRGFLARNEEIDYDQGTAAFAKGLRDGKIPSEFMLPPSLRIGLFEVTKLIGGEGAEKILGEVLTTTGRGIEIAYLARVLQDMAPDKYRDTALAAARELLNRPPAGDAASAFDKNDREFLYGVLAFYKDNSFAAQAQGQLVQSSGQIDRGALKYLQQTVGDQTVAIAIQTLQDARVSNPKDREPLVRIALDYAGVSPLANDLFRAAVNDSTLSLDQRKNLIEDLADHGFSSVKNPSPQDLQLMKTRLELLNQYRNDINHPTITAAFLEAEKDLRNSLARSAAKAAP